MLEHLNRRAGRAFQSVPANMRLIEARMRECGGPADLIAVVDAKVAAWKDDPKMAEYLRPETLFGAQKFASYVGQLTRRDRAGGAWWTAKGFGSEADARRAGAVPEEATP